MGSKRDDLRWLDKSKGIYELRYLLPYLYLAVVTSAPQDSNITFVEIQPLPEDTGPDVISTQRTKVENLTLEIPITTTDSELEQFTTEFEDVQTTLIPETTTRKVTQYTYKPKPTSRTFSKPRPRVISNLNYSNKPKYISSTNLIDKNDKRKFKSHCRCEKIWNCPKLQITIPRCPNEYFLCCF
ncbi:uncharacterized protein LOC116777991 isoform X1 [Danaus plexippus]|uniref:uncharacterized protein LOC116777991 isoform X1 n=1 Tax=Danaus plexippus TaxID=13037 RepID=UPI002AAF315A|nr:uncharacterized protein LOC116777991 isoform X1 [Danaus plexippus]